MSLTLIAEVLAGETWISPGGPVDAVTACGLEPFLWERWHHDVADASQAEAGPATQLELTGVPAAQTGAR